jgi:hypothetical protein
MPRGDGTGPDGKGPRTGRGAGPCKGADAAGSDSLGRGRGFARRLGRGSGGALRRRLRGRERPGRGFFNWGGEATREREETKQVDGS